MNKVNKDGLARSMAFEGEPVSMVMLKEEMRKRAGATTKQSGSEQAEPLSDLMPKRDEIQGEDAKATGGESEPIKKEKER
jgi:hypothetical protein